MEWTDFSVIEAFLNRIGERQRHTLAFIHPNETGLSGATFERKQIQLMMREIRQRQERGFGVYYSMNEGLPVFKQRGHSGKLLADEIIKVHMLGFDIDWITGNAAARVGFEKRALALLTAIPAPSVVVSTGGGIQVLYVLRAPLNVALSLSKAPAGDDAVNDRAARTIRDEVTRLYADLYLVLTAAFQPLIREQICKIDNLANIDRVFRLPGTINFPTQVKIDKGATTRLATILSDTGGYANFYDLRQDIPIVTAEVVRPEKTPYVAVTNLTWSPYKKAVYLCRYIREKCLIDDNQNYTHDLMFPLFGMINRNEITVEQGRELWLLATETGRETAHGDWRKKWNSRKIANYTARDLGTIVYFCRQHGCLMPWSSADDETRTLIEARTITDDCLRHPVIVDEAELFGF